VSGTAPDRSPPRRRGGFSLIELVVVIILLATLATLAGLSAQAAVQKQRLARAVLVATQFDRSLRRAALQRRGEVTGTIDRTANRFRIVSLSPRQLGRSDQFPLPSSVSIDRIRVRGGDRGGNIAVDGQGVSPSYAIRLVSGDARRWVLFVGGSGQSLAAIDADTVNGLLEAP